MRTLHGDLLLEAWERGANQGDLERPLTLLAVAWPGRSWEELADLGLAQLQMELLLLRRASFGDALRSCAPCPLCATRLELDLQISSILPKEILRTPGEATWRHDGVVHSMRAVTSRDLASLRSARDPRKRLLDLCTRTDPPDGCTAARCQAVAMEHFDRLNEGTEMRLTLQCPTCSGTDQVDLDVGRFVWMEVRHAALTLLREIHQLATVYGWSESEILALSNVRRSMYLGMATA
ncbi:MAG: hypothetical protein ACJ72H_00065 [Candidatus Sulfotelmatobacter sp.]|jgi:hypothetical protein